MRGPRATRRALLSEAQEHASVAESYFLLRRWRNSVANTKDGFRPHTRELAELGLTSEIAPRTDSSRFRFARGAEARADSPRHPPVVQSRGWTPPPPARSHSRT